MVTLYIEDPSTGELVEWGTTATDASGNYSFTSLPDGHYEIHAHPVDLPTSPTDYTGWTSTSPEMIAVTLSGSDSTGNNFGYAPALTLDKEFDSGAVGGSSLYEGDVITYTIDLNNELPGDGSATQQCTYTVWATAEGAATSGLPASKRFVNPANALGASELDGSFATSSWVNAIDQVSGTAFDMSAPQRARSILSKPSCLCMLIVP